MNVVKRSLSVRLPIPNKGGVYGQIWSALFRNEVMFDFSPLTVVEKTRERSKNGRTPPLCELYARCVIGVFAPRCSHSAKEERVFSVVTLLSSGR